jgi:hypothetical protein
MKISFNREKSLKRGGLAKDCKRIKALGQFISLHTIYYNTFKVLKSSFQSVSKILLNIIRLLIIGRFKDSDSRQIHFYRNWFPSAYAFRKHSLPVDKPDYSIQVGRFFIVYSKLPF